MAIALSIVVGFLMAVVVGCAIREREHHAREAVHLARISKLETSAEAWKRTADDWQRISDGWQGAAISWKDAYSAARITDTFTALAEQELRH